MRSIQELDCTNKKILVRVDFNIDEESLTQVGEGYRLHIPKETVNHILSFPGSTVTFITHFGRPERENQEKFSTRRLIPSLEKIYEQKVSFTENCLSQDSFGETRIALRENLRFSSEEESNDTQFAEKLADGFDAYVNEAFSVCHREHASIVAITQFLPKFAGCSLLHELTLLDKALSQPERPAVALLGGAKIETKLPLITKLQQQYDTVLLGGIIANEAIDQNLSFPENVYLPQDFRGEEKFDIGDETVKNYATILRNAKTILWNGPLGKFEEPPYNTGTNELLKVITEVDAYTIAGGGESLAALAKVNGIIKIDLLSSGGGAMLQYLAGTPLPGLIALQEESSL